jgi:hypothetical protein
MEGMLIQEEDLANNFLSQTGLPYEKLSDQLLTL